jgi:hypothetical protein
VDDIRSRCATVASERATASRCSDPSALTTKLDPGPAVLVDDDADDLERLLPADVLGERVVEALEPASRSASAARVSASV